MFSNIPDIEYKNIKEVVSNPTMFDDESGVTYMAYAVGAEGVYRLDQEHADILPTDENDTTSPAKISDFSILKSLLLHDVKNNEKMSKINRVVFFINII